MEQIYITLKTIKSFNNYSNRKEYTKNQFRMFLCHIQM